MIRPRQVDKVAWYQINKNLYSVPEINVFNIQCQRLLCSIFSVRDYCVQYSGSEITVFNIQYQRLLCSIFSVRYYCVQYSVPDITVFNIQCQRLMCSIFRRISHVELFKGHRAWWRLFREHRAWWRLFRERIMWSCEEKTIRFSEK